jgi:hypothetical protein
MSAGSPPPPRTKITKNTKVPGHWLSLINPLSSGISGALAK